MLKSKTVTVSINCDSKKVYEFVSNLENLPKWAKTFCQSIKRSNSEWVIQTSQGSMNIRIAPKNDFGILDHTVIPSPGIEVFVPVRVVPNEVGSEVVFTLFHYSHLKNFDEDANLVKQDLNTLKRVMEES